MKNKRVDPKIAEALQLAEQYADIAPGRLVKKQMDADGDPCYEALFKQDLKIRFLFPQFAVDKSDRDKFLGKIFLTTLINMASAAAQGDEQARQVHKIQWAAFLKSDFPKILTRFQLELIEHEWGYTD